MHQVVRILSLLDLMVASLCRIFQETIRVGAHNGLLGSRREFYKHNAFQLPSILVHFAVDKSSSSLDLDGGGGIHGLQGCYSWVARIADFSLVEDNSLGDTLRKDWFDGSLCGTFSDHCENIPIFLLGWQEPPLTSS